MNIITRNNVQDTMLTTSIENFFPASILTKSLINRTPKGKEDSRLS